MNLPASRPDPDEIRITDSSRYDDFAALAGALRELAGVALVYAPSTTTVTAPMPVGVSLPMPAPVGAFPVASVPVARPEPRRGYTLGEVVMYSGMTLMGGGGLTELVWALLRVPMLVPVLGGALAVLGGIAAMVGAELDNRERDGAAR
jgi:hypothetical protein